ncbi:MAG: UDP-2,3-diacylglucosamine diphosphatase, partial [Betaproteobacteria bacterium]
YWIGDDDVATPFNAVMTGFFAGLARAGVKVFVMHGNRDFLMAGRFGEATGATLLEDPALVELGGVRTLLMHGDTLCTDDVDYRNSGPPPAIRNSRPIFWRSPSRHAARGSGNCVN